MRRGVLGAMLAMVLPGMGGQQPASQGAPRGQQTPVGIQAGVSGGVEFARVVVVYGPTGAVNGVFIYQPGTTPGSGNGPVLSGTESATDLYKNTVLPGWVSYAAPGSSTYSQLVNALLRLNFAGMSSPAQLSMSSSAVVQLTSGEQTGADNPAAMQLLSSAANGGSREASFAVDKMSLGSASSQTIPISSAGITTVAQVVTALKAVGIFD
jgi:hypothetical protein